MSPRPSSLAIIKPSSLLREAQPPLLMASPDLGSSSLLVSLWTSSLLHEPTHPLPDTMLLTAAWGTQMDGEVSVRFGCSL